MSMGGTEAGGSGRRSWVGRPGSCGNDGLFSEKMGVLADFVHRSDLVRPAFSQVRQLLLGMGARVGPWGT